MGEKMAAAEAYTFSDEERALIPGSPFVPAHSTRRRIAYGCVGLLTGIATTFPNSLVNANVTNLSGELGVDIAQMSWLPAIFVALNATGNLSLVKGRIQFGIPRVTHGLLIAYFLAGLLQLAWPTFAAAVLVRPVNGVTCAALIALTVYYLQQALPRKLLPIALLSAISL